MLVKYVSLATATQAQVLADIVALACGGSIAGLSAGADKAACAVLANSEASGWTLFDAAGPSSGKVLTAKDAANNDKFVNIYPSNTASFAIFGYDTYNNTTHTGTNSTAAPNKPIGWTSGTAQMYYIYATARNLAIMSSNAAQVLSSFEFTREAPFMSSGIYPAHVVCGNWGLNNGFSIIRGKNPEGSGDLVSQLNSGYMMTIGGNTFAGPYRDASDAIVYPMMDAYLVSNIAFNGLPFGKFIDILMSSNTLGNFMDTANVDGVTYFVVPFGSYARVLLKMV